MLTTGILQVNHAQIQKVLSDGGQLRERFLLFFFLSLMMVGRINIPLLAGHQWPASEMPFKWCFAGVPMMAHYLMLAW